MNAPGKRMHDRLAQYAKQLPSESVLNFNDIQCECTMHTSQVLLDYGPRSEKHVPYLHFIGEVQQVAFPQEMKPYMHGIDALTFPEGKGLQMDAFYKFSRKELAEMVRKGYFDEKFEMPDIFYDNDFELPMSCNLMLVHPDKTGEPPIVFVGLNKPRDMEFTAESSGYDLGSYFEYVPEPEPVVPSVNMNYTPEGVEYDAEMEADLFADDYVEQPVVDEPFVAEEQVLEVQEDDAEVRRLMEQYSQIEANVDIRKNRTRADIDRAIQAASGAEIAEVELPVIEPVVQPVVVERPKADVITEPVSTEAESVVDDKPVEMGEVDETMPESDDVVADDVDDIGAIEDAADIESPVVETEDEEDDNKSARIAKRIAIVEDNQDANQDQPVERKPLPAQFEDVANAADVEYADAGEFEGSL